MSTTPFCWALVAWAPVEPDPLPDEPPEPNGLPQPNWPPLPELPLPKPPEEPLPFDPLPLEPLPNGEIGFVWPPGVLDDVCRDESLLACSMVNAMAPTERITAVAAANGPRKTR